jgi:hypothetical protein
MSKAAYNFRYRLPARLVLFLDIAIIMGDPAKDNKLPGRRYDFSWHWPMRLELSAHWIGLIFA